jgi:predicted N-acetyltransferase YhbS
MSITVRPARLADFEQADQVLQAAFRRTHSFVPMLRLHLAMEPEGIWVATRDAEIVGTASCVDYGKIAYVGLMSVRPDCQGAGIARRLMARVLDWIRARGCGCALLDATDLGVGLYERLGFVDDATAYAYLRSAGTSEASRAAILATSARDVAVELHLSAACEDDLAEIVSFDAVAFGANRAKLFAALASLPDARWIVARHADTRLAGYLVARDSIIGPWAADDPATAGTLLARAVELPFAGAQLVHVPRSNEACRELLASSGFAEQRRLRHMRRGGEGPPGRPEMLFGQSSFGHG